MHYHIIPKNPPVPTPSNSGKNIPKFIVGQCQQPLEYLSHWKDMGVNTLVDIPLNRTQTEKITWVKEADRLGFAQIREVIPEITDDVQNPNFISVSTGDEPDLHKVPVSVLQNLQAKYKGILPTFANFDGGHLLGIEKADADFPLDYQGYVDASDWLCSDLYPVSGWNVNGTNANGIVDLWSPGRASDRLLELSRGLKPVLQYVETSVQQLSWLGAAQRGPTIDEVEIQLSQALSRKLKGIVLYNIAQGAAWPKDFDLQTIEMKSFLTKWIANNVK